MLNVFIYRNNKDEEMLNMSKLKKNKDIFFYNSLGISTSNFIFINNNNLNLNAKQLAYKYLPIAINCN